MLITQYNTFFFLKFFRHVGPQEVTFYWKRKYFNYFKLVTVTV
jgi:hypothetical protein